MRARRFDVAAMSGDHQRSRMVRADDGARIGAARKRDVKHLEVVIQRCDGDDIVTLGIERVRIGTKPQQRLRCSMAAQKRGDKQRRSAVGVLDIGLFAFGDELLDLGGVAACGGVMQPGIDAQLPSFGGVCRGSRRRRGGQR